ncbi:MAG TPA: LysM peptidoglycan-binding domain-containing protein [Anaerolineales bacterium]|nr:LysM peptidoglycan-binding domain-containing protein [Anaerolineales bacterium]
MATRLNGLMILLLGLAWSLSACAPQVSSASAQLANPALEGQAAAQPAPAVQDHPAPVVQPARPVYAPGELVDYVAQAGDTLPQLAIRFNTSVEEILETNDFIPESATTMPPGMPMKIPIYYRPFWGSSFQILPDSLFVNGPAQVGFDTAAFVSVQPGWLKDYTGYVGEKNRSGAEIVDYIALRYSVSPRLLLALLEYQAGALSQPQLNPGQEDFPLGYVDWQHKGLYMQLGWAANFLNNGYYEYRTSDLKELEFKDGRLMVFDPWQNAATVSLHKYFNTLLSHEDYEWAVSPDGFVKTYTALFGDPWVADVPHLPGSLEQPEFTLPFEPGYVWAMTGGPHTGWGLGAPLAAIDFAPPSKSSGCIESGVWATAVAPGLVVRSEIGVVVLDLDGDGDERTGWSIFYLHIATEGRAQVGAQLERGAKIGHPSCEGGAATGTHIHIARKYNGEWLPAGGFHGLLAFNLEGWVAENGSRPYLGRLVRFSQVVTACECSNAASFIETGRR